MSFEQSVILKLRRDYTHDEAVAYLANVTKEREMEIGILRSDLAEAEHCLGVETKLRKKAYQRVEDLTEELGKYKSGLKSDEAIQQTKHQAKLAIASRKKLKDDVRMWRDKYLSLLSKYETGNGKANP